MSATQSPPLPPSPLPLQPTPWHSLLGLSVSQFLGQGGGQEGGGGSIAAAGGSLGGDWFLINTMAMMMQELRCHLIPCPPAPLLKPPFPPAQPICWRRGTCLGLPRWELAPPRPGGEEGQGSLGRDERTPLRECLSLEKAQERLMGSREMANDLTTSRWGVSY